ncbi:MAG: hypothetical protein EKK40_13835 [Bradyrhizobiaceae bacterium]|nr:MAG: hypothetical protein EKK40_13835 [Bradyrhizobiaceae bacterium]
MNQEIVFDVDEILNTAEGIPLTETNANFGTISLDSIPVGRTGLQEPDFSVPLQIDEIGFAVTALDFRKMVGILDLLLKYSDPRHRVVRLNIFNDRVRWDADIGQSFVQVTMHGPVWNHPAGASASIRILSLDDLIATSKALGENASFRVGTRLIEVTSPEFTRPLYVYPHERFLAHSDKILKSLESCESASIETQMLMRAINFVSKFVNTDSADATFDLVEISNGAALAATRNCLAKASSERLAEISVSFRPRLLRFVKPVLPFIGTAKLRHNESFCVIKGDNVLFGFEAIQQSFPLIEPQTIAENLLIPASKLRSVVSATVRTFGPGGVLRLSCDSIGLTTCQMLAFNPADTRDLSISSTVSASRPDGPRALNVSLPASPIYSFLEEFSASNAELGFTEDRTRLILQDTKDQLTCEILVSLQRMNERKHTSGRQ